jgi:uncharacterized protein involved in exopolysaccharide biosynthesis
MDNEIENKGSNNDITIFDIFAILWHYKIMIIVITTLAAIGVVVYSIISLKLPPEKSYKPNVYTARASMLIENRASGGTDLSSILSTSNRNLASMAGVSLPSGSSSNSQLAIFLVGSSTLLDSIVNEFDIINKFKIKKHPKTSGRNKIKKSLKANYERGIFTISFTNKDSVLARDIVNFCTISLERRFDELGLDRNKIEKENLEINIDNTMFDIQQLEEDSRNLEQSVATIAFSGGLPAITRDINRISLELSAKRQIYTQLKVQYELLKINMASEKPVFQILEMAEAPELKSGPSRAKLCMIVTAAAGFFSVFLAFALHAVINIRNDPEAMAKLRGNKNEKK